MSDATATAAESLPEVTRFEANLVRVTRGFVGALPREQTLAIVFREFTRPKCLRAAAVELLEDTLRKGVVSRLARLGWPRERFLRGEQPKSGRLWERFGVEERTLTFSPWTLEWLLWITSENPAGSPKKPKFHGGGGWTVGDLLLQFLAFETLAGSLAATPVLGIIGFKSNALIHLGWPRAFAELETVTEPDFEPWLRSENTWILEALQPWFARRWADLETEKQELVDARRLRAIGGRQGATLNAYLDRLEAAGRWDLARGLAESVRELLHGTAQTLPWFARLDVSGQRMADRSETYRAGLALLHAFGRLVEWNARARNTGYLDEEYQLAQLWKTDWERWQGDLVNARAAEVIQRHQLLNVE